MNAKLLNLFLDAAVEVLEAEVGPPIERGQITLKNGDHETNEVNVHLAVLGRLEGAVIYGMSKETALNIVSRMIGQRMDELDDLAQSGIAELGNVITGRAGTLLAPTGYVTSISVPTLLIGKAKITVQDFRRLVVPLHCQDGVIDVHLALRESPTAA